MVDYRSSKHKELSEQLTAWWCTQTDFKTKKALAGLLKVHPDTLGDYFSGRQFPKSDIAKRLRELTNIVCLKPRADADPLSEMVPQESSPMPLLLPVPSAASIEKPPQPSITGATGLFEEKYRLGGIREVVPGQAPMKLPKKGARCEERVIVISLQRTSCPFCAHDIAKFTSCLYCGQHLVWASVPLEKDEPL